MPKRRALRFALEVVFLVAVAAALTVAHLRAPIVAGVMLLGWIIAALFEWAAFLETPHFGRGLPPRYYVPDVALPPAHTVDQEEERERDEEGGEGEYPDSDAGEDELTWIVPPAAWGEVLEDWPVLDSTLVGEETEIAVPDPIEAEHFVEPAAEVSEAELTSELDLSGVVVPDTPVEQEEEVSVEAIPVPLPPVEADEPDVAVALPAVPVVPLIARHRIDPLALPQGGRFRRRRVRDDRAEVEVPARPPTVRALPGRAKRED